MLMKRFVTSIFLVAMPVLCAGTALDKHILTSPSRMLANEGRGQQRFDGAIVSQGIRGPWASR